MKTTTIYFDLETAGLEDHHADIQIAAIAAENWEEVASFEAKIEFDASKADPEALAMNSYDANVWEATSILEAYAVERLASFLEGFRVIKKVSKRTSGAYYIARLAGHNVKNFDCPRLMRMFKRNSRFLPADCFQPLDTLQLAIWKFADTEDRPENLKLGTLAEYFGIESEGAHDALADVRVNVQVAQRLWEM